MADLVFHHRHIINQAAPDDFDFGPDAYQHQIGSWNTLDPFGDGNLVDNYKMVKAEVVNEGRNCVLTFDWYKEIP